MLRRVETAIVFTCFSAQVIPALGTAVSRSGGSSPTSVPRAPRPPVPWSAPCRGSPAPGGQVPAPPPSCVLSTSRPRPRAWQSEGRLCVWPPWVCCGPSSQSLGPSGGPQAFLVLSGPVACVRVSLVAGPCHCGGRWRALGSRVPVSEGPRTHGSSSCRTRLGPDSGGPGGAPGFLELP